MTYRWKTRPAARFITILLTLVMLLELLPMSAFAASWQVDPDAVSIVQYKGMNMATLATGRQIARYDFLSANNTFYQGFNLNDEDTWVKLSYTIEKSQPVSLMLYHLKPDEVNIEVDDDGKHHKFATLEYFRDPEAADYGASVPEKFLDGDLIGYINGVRITNNIESPDEDASVVRPKTITNDDWLAIISGAHYGSLNSLKEGIINIYAYGFEGKKLELGPMVSTTALDANDYDVQDKVSSVSEDTRSPDSEDISPDEPMEMPDEDTTIPEETDVEPVEDEDPALMQEEDIDATNPSIEEGDSQVPEQPEEQPSFRPLDVEDVLGSTIMPIASQDDAPIQNFVLWDGSLVDENGTEIEYTYDDGYYVIVMEPTYQATKVYNLFLGFQVDNSATPENAMAYLAYDEVKDHLEQLGLSEDPVNLMTGSFSWEYRDLALYGKDDLEFTRYYESIAADRDFGLGYGWTTNYTYQLDVEPLFVKVTIPGGGQLYFDRDYDSTYRAVGDYTLERSGGSFVLRHKNEASYLFDSDCLLRTITYQNGNTIQLDYLGNRLIRISNDTGSFDLSYTNGKLATVTDSVGRTVSFSYDGGVLTGVQNPDGDSFVYAYNSADLLTTVSNLKGQVYVENTYDGRGRVIHQYAANVGVFDFTYDEESRFNTCTGTDGYLLELRYDQRGWPVSFTNVAGTWSITVDDQGHVTSDTDRDGNTTTYQHDAAGNISRITHPDGTSESFTYDPNRIVTAYTDRNGNSVRYTVDGQGNILSYTDGRGNTTSFAYDSKGNRTSLTDPTGAVTTYTYDKQGNCLTETDALGNTTSYTYDEQGRLAKVTYPNGSTASYEYTEAGKLVKITDALGNTQTYTVDGNGFNTSESDWMGNITTYTRNIQNQVTSVTDPLGNKTSYAYDDRGNLSVQTDANGNSVTYTYDGAGRMVSMTDALGNTWTYSYNNESQMTSVTDPMGGKTTTVYDAAGRTQSVTDARDNTTSYTYDGVGNVTAVRDANGKSTKNIYDANGNLISSTDRNGAESRYEYDENNRLTKVTDAEGGVTTYVYDALGQITKMVSSEGSEVSAVYDSMGQTISNTNALGFTTQYEYDALGRVTAVTAPDGTTVSYTYDANGQLLTATNELGDVTSYTYDANGRMTSTTDPIGGVTSYTYDAVGNITAVTDPMGHTTIYTYNANNAIASVTDANGGVVSYTYDANGQVASVTDAEGGVTSYAYDKNGNLTSVTDAEGNTTSYTYDKLDRLTQVKDARGNIWTYSYDNEGNLIQASDPLKNSISKSYDKLGQLVSETDRNGNTWKYAYDGDGRMTSKTDPLGNTTTYTYDAEGQLLKEATALGRETSYTYDSMGRTTAQTDPMDHVVTFYYDDLGQLTGLTNKDGTNVAYTYDANGNNLTVTDEEGHVVTYTYDADGRMTKLHNAKGYDTKYEYDNVGNLVKVTDAMDGVTSYDYDANGNLLSVTNTDGYTTSYTYDKLGQVLTITDPEGGVTAAEYDGNGNIVKITQANGKSISYTYDKADRLISYVDAEGYTTELSYDGNGNVISVTDGNGNVTHYTYDGLDRLVGRTDAEGGSASKTYDADGRLIQVVDEEGAVTKYAYDDCDRVTSMTNAEGYTTTYTYDEMDRVLTITDPRKGVITYTYTDRGDVASVTDQEGYVTSFAYDENRNLVKTTTLDGDTIYTYDPLDRIIAITTPDGETEQIAYNGEGQVVSTTDKSGHTTKYILDGNGQVVETIDALGNSSLFEYDAMGNLTKTSLHRVDAQNGVDEWEITSYEYDGRGLATKTTDALGNVTSYTYDGNGNLASKTDADNYTTQYTYNGLDMITHINYNGGKQVEYAYNAVGDLVRMEDWTGVNTFEYDLLSQLKKVTDHKGNVVEYDYDGNGNRTAITYPDGTVAAYTYDKVNNLTSVTESQGTTTYQYDGMGRAARMEYPNGWVEEYTYDNMGRLVKVTDTDPFQLYNKTPKVKYEYKYDANGNVIYEFQRDSDAEENLKSHTDYTYDALNRLTGSTQKTERYPNESAIRTYTYDSLGNMIQETGPSSQDRTSYQYNSLNQLTAKEVCSYISKVTMIHDYGYTYDNRGNLVKEEEICSPTTQGPKNITIGTYLYDETDRMVQGTNKDGEASLYTFNGLGVRVGSELILEDNTHGYTDFHCLTPSIETTVGGPQGPEVVKADYVIDYTRLNIDQRVLMKLEEGGYDFRYVYGLDKIQVTVNSEGSNWWGQNIKPCVMMNYVHTDRLGSVVNLSDQYGRVTARADYDDWGKVTAYTDITVDGGFRRLLPEITYATHEYDDVLGQFYAKARMYDAGDRRFTAMDPVKGNVFDSISMVQYLYVANNPIIAIDLLGLWYLKQDKNGNYFASAESYGEGFLKTFDFLGNAITSSGNMFTNWKNGYKVVGGNSTNKYNSAIDIISGYVEDKVKDTVKEEAVEKVFGSAMKDFIGPIDQLYDTITFFDRLEKNISIPKYDYIAFHLLDLAKISPEGPDMDRVTLILDSAYLFIETMNWFFTAPVYTTFHRTALGGGVVLPSPTVFESLTVLSNMKKSGKATSEINAKINEYYNSFLCGNKSSNPVMSQVVEISDFSGTYLSSLYYQYLINYDSILGVVVNGFKEFMSGILNYYDSSVA